MVLPQVLFGSLEQLGELAAQRGVRRVMLLSGPSQRGVDRASQALEGLSVHLFNQAKRHVPNETVELARVQLEQFKPELLVAIGGGAVMGLGKALRLTDDVPLVAVPTTYAGSEMTNIYGITQHEASGQGARPRKITGRDERVRPELVLYDVSLTLEMPISLTVSSLLNAMASPLSVLSTGQLKDQAPEAIKLVCDLYGLIEQLLLKPRDKQLREQAVSLAASAVCYIGDYQPGEHHQLVHLLGGRFDLEHAALHSLVLPHSIHRLRKQVPSVVSQIETGLGLTDFESCVFDLLGRAELNTSLESMGVGHEQFSSLVANQSEPGDFLWGIYQGRKPSQLTPRD